MRPDVLGPVTGPRPPWGAPRVDPARYGYCVKEYQLRGVAACYEAVAERSGGEVEVEEVGAAAYHTRLLVIRPEHPARFNHTVLLNW
jgi:hypothetical protein